MNSDFHWTSISDLLVMSLPKEEGSYRKDVDAAGTHDLTGEKLDLKLKRI